MLPDNLEPRVGAAQCNYELLRAWSGWMKEQHLVWTIGSGTLLGAMRTEPPGLLQWEHDVDIYMPAKDAYIAATRLHNQCGSGGVGDDNSSSWDSPWCKTLDFRGHVDVNGGTCCGFGFKVFHRELTSTAKCEIDVLVLALSPGKWAMLLAWF